MVNDIIDLFSFKDTKRSVINIGIPKIRILINYKRKKWWG